nr:winged helix-turn-helix domain-containing protein [Burkholderia territorii]
MIRIDNVTILPERHLVVVDEICTHIGSRAMELLIALVEANGAIVTKRTLIDRVWPTTVVLENNLHVHVSAIRAALGCRRDLLVSVPGRGYRLVRPIYTEPMPLHEQSLFFPVEISDKSTPAGGQLFGREVAILEIDKLLSKSQILTLIGPGGIGKSQLAAAVAQRYVRQLDGGVWALELSNNQNESFASAIASAMKFEGATTTQSVVERIPLTPSLLILDNCDMMINDVAEFAQQLIQCNSRCKLLVTSRESLNVPQESIFRVGPLDTPQDDDSESIMLNRSSVQLFLARARTFPYPLSWEKDDLRLVGLVCSQLDGVPLAIEFAVARATVLGVDCVARYISDCIDTLGGGYRTAPARHKTLTACLDWSYERLSITEQKVFRCLAGIPGRFKLADAFRIVSRENLSTNDIIQAICNLAAKSLLVAHFENGHVEYSMLNVTKLYARRLALSEAGRPDDSSDIAVSY